MQDNLSQEEVLKISNWNSDREDSYINDVIPEDKKVLYKIIDSNNFAVITKNSKVIPSIIDNEGII